MEELIPIVLFMCVAAVAILRPLTTRLGGLLESMTKERQMAHRGADDTDLARIRLLLEHMSKRLDVMEDRLDFTERLVSTTRSREALPANDRIERTERLDPLRLEETARLSAR